MFFAFIGVYLLAVAFSTTDEDLLRERTVAVAQLVMAVPVVFSFAVAPLIFLFLHIHTLIRYDMLAANLRQFEAELESIPREEDRERCRHLLANVEFLRQLGASPGTHLASQVFRFVSWFMIAFFPVMVLLIIQLSALRYQDGGIVFAQRVALFADLGLLVWFFHRQWRIRQVGATISRWRARACVGRSLLLWVAPIVAFNLAYMGVLSPRATIVGQRAAVQSVEREKTRLAGRERSERILLLLGRMLADQPVDLLLCKKLHFGCRYLRVPQTLLLAAAADPRVLARLRTEEGHPSDDDINSIEGLKLRGRSLRFIDLSESRLYAADLYGADVHGASLWKGSLTGANLIGAQLQGADLTLAQLLGADLSVAQLQGAILGSAQLQGADLSYVELQGANLRDAQLQDADLTGAQLEGADLSDAQLQGAYLSYVELQGANLRDAQLQGADLSDAQLQGAGLKGAQLLGTNLRGTNLWQTAFGKDPRGRLASNLTLADLREVTFEVSTDKDRADILASLDAIPNEGRRKDAKERVEKSLTPQSPPAVSLPEVWVEQPLLVNDPADPRWSAIDTTKKTADVAVYDRLLAPFLFDVAKQSPEVATGIARRVIAESAEEKDRTVYPDLARRLLEGRKDGTIRLPDDVAAQLEPIAARGKPAQEATPKR